MKQIILACLFVAAAFAQNGPYVAGQRVIEQARRLGGQGVRQHEKHPQSEDGPACQRTLPWLTTLIHDGLRLSLVAERTVLSPLLSRQLSGGV